MSNKSATSSSAWSRKNGRAHPLARILNESTSAVILKNSGPHTRLKLIQQEFTQKSAQWSVTNEYVKCLQSIVKPNADDSSDSSSLRSIPSVHSRRCDDPN